uniref:Uncharacterized protein n=1 Tax=Triticum urartu TaxID=4572 RepID=A0A8R7PDW7_TRIUA
MEPEGAGGGGSCRRPTRPSPPPPMTHSDGARRECLSRPSSLTGHANKGEDESAVQGQFEQA